MKVENKMNVSIQQARLSPRGIGATTIQEGQTSMREEATSVPQQRAKGFYLCKSHQGLKMSGAGGVFGGIGGWYFSAGFQANICASIAVCAGLGCIYGGLGNCLFKSAPDAAIYTDSDQNTNQAPDQIPVQNTNQAPDQIPEVYVMMV